VHLHAPRQLPLTQVPALRISRTCPATCRPASADGCAAAWGTSCSVGRTRLSTSKSWHLRHRELAVLYWTRLQKSQRTTSRVSTLICVVAIGCVRSQSGLSEVLFCTAMCATFGHVNHNCQVETWVKTGLT